jgi:hypothetical protein
MPGTACERNGHTAWKPGFPFCSAFDFSALRTEHLCAPSFRQHAGTSLCTRPTASAGRRGPPPKNKISRAASIRRKVQLAYSKLPAQARERSHIHCERRLPTSHTWSQDCHMKLMNPTAVSHSSASEQDGKISTVRIAPLNPLIRARSVVQVHPGPSFKSPVNMWLFSLFPFRGIPLKNPFCQKFAKSSSRP